MELVNPAALAAGGPEGHILGEVPKLPSQCLAVQGTAVLRDKQAARARRVRWLRHRDCAGSSRGGSGRGLGLRCGRRVGRGGGLLRLCSGSWISSGDWLLWLGGGNSSSRVGDGSWLPRLCDGSRVAGGSWLLRLCDGGRVGGGSWLLRLCNGSRVGGGGWLCGSSSIRSREGSGRVAGKGRLLDGTSACFHDLSCYLLLTRLLCQGCRINIHIIGFQCSILRAAPAPANPCEAGHGCST